LRFVQPQARKAPLSRQVMKQFSKCIGLDVHTETIAVAVAEGDGGEVRFFGEIVNTPEALDKLVKQLSKAGAQLSF
jgi:transposase